jgi:protein-export membrane protein SecD
MYNGGYTVKIAPELPVPYRISNQCGKVKRGIRASLICQEGEAVAKIIFIVLIAVLLVTLGLIYSSYKKGSLTPEEAFARDGGLRLVLEVDDTATRDRPRGEVVGKMVEIIRDRVHQLGVRNALVRREGDKRIVIQLPGMEDAERAKRLVGRKALLEFKLVREPEELARALQNLDLVLKGAHMGDGGMKTDAAGKPIEEKTTENKGEIFEDSAVAEASVSVKTHGDSILDEMIPPIPGYGEVETIPNVFDDERPFTSYLLTPFRGGAAVNETNIETVDRLLTTPEAKRAIPPRSEFLWAAESRPFQEGGRGRILYLVEEKAGLTGHSIMDAAARSDPDYPSDLNVMFRLDREGTVIFTKLTALNIGRQLAIVLDGKVISAPVIQTKIPGGEARITGLESDQEANDLAIVLRSGSLPATITITEEQIVPPGR